MQKTVYCNPSSIVVYHHTLACIIINLRGWIASYCSLSVVCPGTLRNIVCPGTLFMLVLLKTRAQTSARLAASLLWWEVDASLFLDTGEHTCGWSKNSLSMHTKVKRPDRFVPLSLEESKKWCHYNSTESGKQWLGVWVWKPRYQYMYILASTTNSRNHLSWNPRIIIDLFFSRGPSQYRRCWWYFLQSCTIAVAAIVMNPKMRQMMRLALPDIVAHLAEDPIQASRAWTDGV